jgi:cation diffusion facilitator family transporter
MAHDSPSPYHHIVQALFVNLAISVAKGVVAVLTSSGAMLAETIHSVADCFNQLLLLWGVRVSGAPTTHRHPFGKGRETYFWSFIVALLLFTGGGIFSIYEGIHKLSHPEPVTNLGWAIGVLLFALILEGWSTISNVKEINRRRSRQRFYCYLVDTKDADLIVVFGENLAASLGLLVGLLAVLLTALTGNLAYDAFGSIVIGFILVAVAIFIAREVKSLIVGESADPLLAEAVGEVLKGEPRIVKILNLVTLQQGPGQVVLHLKLAFESELSITDVCNIINSIEADIKRVRPEVRWCFVEPDIPRQS